MCKVKGWNVNNRMAGESACIVPTFCVEAAAELERLPADAEWKFNDPNRDAVITAGTDCHAGALCAELPGMSWLEPRCHRRVPTCDAGGGRGRRGEGSRSSHASNRIHEAVLTASDVRLDGNLDETLDDECYSLHEDSDIWVWVGFIGLVKLLYIYLQAAVHL